MSPHARVRHGRVTGRLRRLLDAQAPPGLVVEQDIGVDIAQRTTYYVPDIVVIADATPDLDDDDAYLTPSDVLLAVEVLSRGNKGGDLVLKRHDYARVGIAEYWIVDPDKRTLTILRSGGGSGVDAETAMIEAGEVWRSATPFPLAGDPADFC